MFKHSFFHSLFLLVIIISSVGCKTNKTTNKSNANLIFRISTTPCFGECPVFEVSLHDNKILIFEGKQHTNLKGMHEKQLSDSQFEAFINLLEVIDWNKLKVSYTTQMTDLPTQNFIYNRNGVSKNISKYGPEPEELSDMSVLILTFVEEQVFIKK